MQLVATFSVDRFLNAHIDRLRHPRCYVYPRTGAFYHIYSF